MKTIKIMKSIMMKAIVVTSFCSLFLFPASANLAGPDGGLQGGVSAIAPAQEKTVLDQTQTDRKPFDDNAQSSLLRAAPGGGTGGQKQEVPVGEGIWALIGLAIVYGVVRRNSKRDSSCFVPRSLQ